MFQREKLNSIMTRLKINLIWKNLSSRTREWTHVAVQKRQKNTVQCVLLFFVMFSRFLHSVLTFDVIIFLNDLQMVFSVLAFSKIVTTWKEGGGGELVTNGNMGVGGVKIVIFAVTFFLNHP